MSEQEPKVKLFREKSLEAVESPESLNDYLRVTSPKVWLVMAAVIVLLLGFILWGIFGHIRTTAEFAVSVGPDRSVCYVTYESIEKVLKRGIVNVGGTDYPLKTNGEFSVTFITDETPPQVLLNGKLNVGDPVIEVGVLTDLPAGHYKGEVVTEDLRPVSLLLQ